MGSSHLYILQWLMQVRKLSRHSLFHTQLSFHHAYAMKQTAEGMDFAYETQTRLHQKFKTRINVLATFFFPKTLILETDCREFLCTVWKHRKKCYFLFVCLYVCLYLVGVKMSVHQNHFHWRGFAKNATWPWYVSVEFVKFLSGRKCYS